MRYLSLLLLLPALCSRLALCAQIPGNGTLSGLRTTTFAPAIGRTAYFVTDAGMEGFFNYDPVDKSTPDDSVMTIVTVNGSRFKRVAETGILNAKWFGALGNGSSDDWAALQKGINYILSNPSTGRTLYLPPGTYRISKPLIIARLQGSVYKQASINLVGPANSKSLGAGAAVITPSFNNTFAIGIQLGKGVLVKDLLITGRFNFPDKLNPVQIDTLAAAEWTDGSTRDNPLSPYCGIVIDPFCDSTVFTRHTDMYPGLHAYYPAGLSRGGSTAVQIVGCSIRNFIIGVMLTPSNQQNADLIDVIDCDISSNKVGYAMGQAQSKECHVERLKCWGPTHTLFDNLSYGFRHGDGANTPLVDGVNIASHVKQLCRIAAVSFGGVFRNIYAEGLYRIGYVGGAATISFEDCQLNFSTLSPADPYPDFYVLGSGVEFHNCMLRLYTGGKGARLILSNTNGHYEGGVMGDPPVTVNLDNNSLYPNPSFSNVSMFYASGILGSSNLNPSITTSPFVGANGMRADPVYYGNTYIFHDPYHGTDVTYKCSYHDNYERTARITGNSLIHADLSTWSGYFKLASSEDLAILKEGDFILTSGLHYQDQYTGIYAPTYPVGFIKRISHDTVYLRNLAQGIYEGVSLPLWTDYYVNADGLFTGDMAAGDNMITHVQGTFPQPGDRPDIPMLPVGSFVTSVDQKEGTIKFSNKNGLGRSFKDYTFINGYPSIEMYSAYDLPTLLRNGKTLVGGSYFYQLDATTTATHLHSYPATGTASDIYKIVNTHINGDTSLHKFNCIPVFTRKAPPVLLNAIGACNIKLSGDNTDMQVIVEANAPVDGNFVRIGINGAGNDPPIAVISNGDAFTATNASRLFCSPSNPAELIVGGVLPVKGTYIFNIHVGR